jgi:glycerol-3-phosphate dehydrogenase
MGAPWTEHAVLPGGELPGADFEAWFAGFRSRNSWLPPELALGYARRYGARAIELLGDAKSQADLGRFFGGGLYEREARFLMAEEWATTAEDIVMRRTKHALHMTAAERETFAAWIAGGAP